MLDEVARFPSSFLAPVASTAPAARKMVSNFRLFCPLVSLFLTGRCCRLVRTKCNFAPRENNAPFSLPLAPRGWHDFRFAFARCKECLSFDPIASVRNLNAWAKLRSFHLVAAKEFTATQTGILGAILGRLAFGSM